jgi:hypothetical protein
LARLAIGRSDSAEGQRLEERVVVGEVGILVFSAGEWAGSGESSRWTDDKNNIDEPDFFENEV